MKSPPDGGDVVLVGALVVVGVLVVVGAGIVVVVVVVGRVVVVAEIVVLVVGRQAENDTLDGRYVWFPLRQHGVPAISLIVCALPPELLVRINVVGVAASASM
jgi:hypothetical protein